MTECPHPDCTTIIQRAERGNLHDGLYAHYTVVHPGIPVPLPEPPQES